MQIFHIVDRGVWAAAVGAGEYRPPSVDSEGFIHFSFADQVERTANARFRDEPDLIVVIVDSGVVEHELRVEDSYGSGETFPHLYATLPTSFVIAMRELTRDENGDWVLSRDAAAGPSSTDR